MFLLTHGFHKFVLHHPILVTYGDRREAQLADMIDPDVGSRGSSHIVLHPVGDLENAEANSKEHQNQPK